MATAEQVALVRSYADEPDETNWTDVQLDELIDELGSVDAATARLWREKAARYSKLVDVTEAGASRKNSQAYDHAKEMAAHWDAVVSSGVTTGTTKVHKIVRS